MLKIGNYVVHSGHGVCTIIDKKFNENMNKYFYQLKTLSNNMSIMIPEEKVSSLLRPLNDKKTTMNTISYVEELEINYAKDNKERKNQFQILVSSNSFNDTLYLIKCLYHLSDEKKKEKKTLGSIDSQFLQQAYRKAIDEIILSLDITKIEADELLSKFRSQQ